MNQELSRTSLLGQLQGCSGREGWARDVAAALPRPTLGKSPHGNSVFTIKRESHLPVYTTPNQT